MLAIHHKARTPPAVRAEIAGSSESYRVPPMRYVWDCHSLEPTDERIEAGCNGDRFRIEAQSAL